MYAAGTFGVFFVLLALIVFWAISVYNRLVRQRALKDEGWSGIDVQLKRRHDVVGNLVNAVKGFMQHEKSILEEVTRQRSMSREASGAAAVGLAETGLSQAVGRLFAVMENYPTLKANENVLQLQAALADLEDEIQKARRYYNATVRDLNVSIQSFPSNIIAQRFGFQKADFFELTTVQERDVPTVAL
ncbi:MAG: LemA family protein [Desulfovibrionales bacterium]|nr:LemA family protein [Desulfovibrionales bacterium]